MQAVREWWENNVMVMGRVGVWRCVLECLATELEYLDQYCLFPLFRLLLQLLFSIRVGRKPDGMTNSDQPSVTTFYCILQCYGACCHVFMLVLLHIYWLLATVTVCFILYNNMSPFPISYAFLFNIYLCIFSSSLYQVQSKSSQTVPVKNDRPILGVRFLHHS